MRYIAAYLLLQIGGNSSPSAADISKLLGTVGVEVDDSRVESLISELSGNDINEVRNPIARTYRVLTPRQLIAEGTSKLGSVPSGGAAAAPSGGAGGAAPAAAAEEKKEEPATSEETKEEAKEEPKAEEKAEDKAEEEKKEE